MRFIDTGFGKFNVFDNCEISHEVERGKFLEESCRGYFDSVPPGGLFVDAGANFGFYSVYMARRGCSVVAFEPARKIFNVLKSNISLNHLEGFIEAYDVSLWDGMADTVVISADWLTSGNSRILFDKDGDVDYENMPNSGGMSVVPAPEAFPQDLKKNVFEARSLDSYELWTRSEKLHLIKVDCQGADLRVLRGSVKTIEAERPLLLFEYEAQPAKHIGDTLHAYIGFLGEIKYDSEILTEGSLDSLLGLEHNDSLGHRTIQFSARPRRYLGG